MPSPLIRVKIADSLRGEDNVRFVKSYTAPLLLMTGTNDRVTPSSFAETLFAKSATAESKRRIALSHSTGQGRTDVGVLCDECDGVLDFAFESIPKPDRLTVKVGDGLDFGLRDFEKANSNHRWRDRSRAKTSSAGIALILPAL